MSVKAQDLKEWKLDLGGQQTASCRALVADKAMEEAGRIFRKEVKNVKKPLPNTSQDKGKEELSNELLVGMVLDAVDGLQRDVFGLVVARTEATAVRFARYRAEWEAELAVPKQKFTSTGRSALAIADDYAQWLVKSVLDFVAEKCFGKGWDTMIEKARLDEALLILKKPISGSPSEVLEGARRFIEAHGAVHKSEAGKLNETMRELLVRTLMDRLDKQVAKVMPAVRELVDEKVSEDDIAQACADAAEKAGRREPKKLLAAPVLDQDGAAAASATERPAEGGFKGNCGNCEEYGHKRKHCPHPRRHRPLKNMRCAACGAKDEHTTRLCPKQQCLGCGAAGHAIVDCSSNKKDKEEKGEGVNKASNSKYPELVLASETGAVVCKTLGTVEGQPAILGLDSYAGKALVLEELVKHKQVQPTDVSLMGVAPNAVQPVGQTRVVMEAAGTGEPFAEDALVVKHLPGNVQALVSFRTLRKLGFAVSDEAVTLAGHKVELVAAAEEVTVSRAEKPSEEEEKKIAKEAQAQQASVKVAEPESPRRETDGGSGQGAGEEAQSGWSTEALRKLRESGRRYGERALTFAELEKEGGILWVEVDKLGMPIFQMALGAADKPLPDRSSTDKHARTTSTSKADRKLNKQALKAARERLTRKRAAKKERLEADFARVEKELEDNARERAMQEQLQAEEAAAVAAVEIQKGEWKKITSPELLAGASAKQWKEEAVVAAAVDQPRTVRAAETIERYAKTGQWVRADTEGLVGSVQEPTIVNVDEYCLPDFANARQDEEYEELVKAKVAETAYSEAGKKRYGDLLRGKGREVYLMRMEARDYGQLKVPKLQLHVTEGPPLRDKRRPMAPDDEQWLKETILELDRMGVTFKPSQEQEARVWVANPVVVKQRKEGSDQVVRRLCIDYWQVHSRLKLGPQRVPHMTELGDRVRHAKLWDADDGFSGYYQYPLDEESQLLTGFYTPLGIRCFRIMPMGIATAPDKWNTAMAEIFADVPTTRMFTYMDDFFRFTGSGEGERKSSQQLEKEHLDLFEEFLDKVRGAGLKLKLIKAKHGRTEIAALGQMYGNGERWMAEKTIEIINDYPTPTRGKQLERFLALGNYYSDYVDNYAGRVARLRVLARKRRWGKADFIEGSPERQDYEAIKAALVERTKLALPDWTKPFIVKSDWSKEAMGAVLLQRDDKGRLRPLMFCSRKCTNAEAMAGAPDGELLALVYAVRKFERYLAGRKFEAYVDQGSLGWVKDKALSSINNRRLQGAFAYLRQFVFDLFYRPSKDMQDADAMSRIEHKVPVAAVEECEPEAIFVVERSPGWKEIVKAAEKLGLVVPAAPVAEAEKGEEPGVAQVELEGVWGFQTELRDMGSLQEGDEEVMAIRKLMGGRSLKDVEVVPSARNALAEYLGRDPACAQFVEGQDGRLYHVEMVHGKERRQLVVPVQCRGRLVVANHAAQGHVEEEAVISKLRKKYFWPTLRADVIAWVGACGCKRKLAERKQKVGLSQSLKVQRPGRRVTFDLFGPLPTSQAGNAYVLVMMDVGTREVMLEALPTKEARPIARKLFERVYLRGMTPEEWQSDLAQELSGKVMTELAEILGAEFKHSSPYHPQTNTHVERFNRTLATQLSLMMKRDDQSDWDQYLKFVEYAQLVGAHSALGRLSPLFLKGGWEALDPTDVAMGVQEVQTRDKDLGVWMRDLQIARQIAMESQEQALMRQAKYELGKRHKKRDVDVGDTVWVMFPNVGVGKSKKLAFRMHGPYVLNRWLHGGRRVAVLGHKDEPRDEIVVHVDRMVRKKELPERLIKEWKPIRLGNAEPEKRRARVEHEMRKAEEDAKKRNKKSRPDVEKDQQAELADPDLRIEKIVNKSFVMDEPRGKKKKHSGWQYKVRFVGYGPRADEWYWEEDLMQTAPEMVEEFNEEWDRAAKQKSLK